MRNLLTILFLCLTLPLVAQVHAEQNIVNNEEVTVRENADDIDRLVERLSAFGQSIPQEKVYLHMDNTSYFVGDTIRFAAYTRQTNTDKPSRISGVLYVELLNNDGYLVERLLVDMKEGRGHGQFVLSPDSYGGFYEIRAYTRWQLNWGITERKHSEAMKSLFINREFEDRYFQDYDKLYSRVFPVYDQPSVAGEYAENMTLRAMRRLFKGNPDQPRLTLTLYPEGGSLVQGMESTVAYEAVWSDGRQAEGTLLVEEQQIATEHRGRSTFRYTPGANDKVKVTFTDTLGNTVTAHLPKVEAQGGILHLSEEDSCWTMRVRLSPDLLPDSMGWTVMHEGRLQCKGRLTTHDQTIPLPTTLPVGVHQATLFDARGRVWADRLFFVGSSTLTQPNVAFSGLRPYYQPFEKIDLDLQSSLPSGRLSLAVRDAALSDVLFDNGTMLTEMLLSSEIKGFVPDPGWYFQSSDSLHRRALDLLMLTQGWRRFVWHDMAVRGSWDLTQPDEPSPVLTGQVLNLDETPFYGLEAVRNTENRDTYEWPYDQNHVLNYFDPNISWGDYVPSLLDDQGMARSENGLIPVSTRANSGYISSLFEAKELRVDNIRMPAAKALEREVLVHAEMVSLDGKEVLTSETMTRDGRFRLLLPKAYNDYMLFLSASDSTKWTEKVRRNGYTWIQSIPSERNLPKRRKKRFRIQPSQLAVRVQFPYPRYVQPYSFYQCHVDSVFDPISIAADELTSDGSHILKEVKVKRLRTRLNTLDQSKPAFVIDAYEAYNQALDAGMKNAEPEIIARTLLGTYGLDDPYRLAEYGETVTRSSNLRVRYGYDQLRRMLNDVTLNRDSAYMFNNLCSMQDHGMPSDGKFFFHPNKDKYVFYTDFCPRLWGSPRYEASNLPETNIGVFLFPEDDRRAMYRDRRYIMSGISVAEDYYQPDYTQRHPLDNPADYRRTLYWNPDLQLDAQGHARISLWNNSKQTSLIISAEGTTADGNIVVQ